MSLVCWDFPEGPDLPHRLRHLLPEDRALVEMRYQGGKLKMCTFPAAFAIATMMYRDSPDMFVQAFGTEAKFRARNRRHFPQGEDAAPEATSESGSGATDAVSKVSP